MQSFKALLGALLMPGLLTAQAAVEPSPGSMKRGEIHLLLLANHITPGEHLSTVNSRSGGGLILGFEGETLRIAVDGGIFPVQSRLVEGEPQRITVIAWGFGCDFKLPVSSSRLNQLYGLGGIHMDYWSCIGDGPVSSDDSSTRSSSNSRGNLGFRLGAGLRLNKFVAEARYRVSLGDVRVDSDRSGTTEAWSAYELCLGFRL